MSDDLAGRIIAHAFHDELEKIAKAPRYVRDVIKGVVPEPKGYAAQQLVKTETHRAVGRTKKQFLPERKSAKPGWDYLDAGTTVQQQPKNLWQKVAPAGAPGAAKVVHRREGKVPRSPAAGLSELVPSRTARGRRKARLAKKRKKMGFPEGAPGGPKQSSEYAKAVRHRYKYGPKRGQTLPGSQPSRSARDIKSAPRQEKLPPGITDRKGWRRAQKEVEDSSLASRMRRVQQRASAQQQQRLAAK